MDFKCNYANHEKQARKWLLDNKLAAPDTLALMSTQEVEDMINENCSCFKSEDDWLLVLKKDMPQFAKIANWIER